MVYYLKQFDFLAYNYIDPEDFIISISKSQHQYNTSSYIILPSTPTTAKKQSNGQFKNNEMLDIRLIGSKHVKHSKQRGQILRYNSRLLFSVLVYRRIVRIFFRHLFMQLDTSRAIAKVPSYDAFHNLKFAYFGTHVRYYIGYEEGDE